MARRSEQDLSFRALDPLGNKISVVSITLVPLESVNNNGPTLTHATDSFPPPGPLSGLEKPRYRLTTR